MINADKIILKVRINKKVFYLIFIAVLVVQSSLGQNLLLLHDKVEKADISIRSGKRIKVETIDNQIVKGKLIEIKDSSIVIDNNSKTEINLTSIKYFHCRNASAWKTAGGVLLAFYSVVMTGFIITGLTQSTETNADPNATKDNPVPGIVIVASIALPALYAGTYYGLVHKKKYDTKGRYELNIVRHK